ncbi:MAG: ROK family protein [Oscillospiraceae bacterium]
MENTVHLLSNSTPIALKGQNSSDNQRNNRYVILKHLFQNGASTRNDFVTVTNLRNATITNIINEMLALGLIVQTGVTDGGRGRRVAVFSLNHDAYYAIAIRISHHYIKIGAYDTALRPVYFDKIFVDAKTNIRKVCALIVSGVSHIQQRFARQRSMIGIAIAVNEYFYYSAGDYFFQGDPNSPPFYFGEYIWRALGTVPIVNSDQNFSTCGTYNQVRPEPGVAPVLFLYISFKLECGIVVNGNIVDGFTGNSGKVGKIHFTTYDGRRTTFDDELSIAAIEQKAAERLPRYPGSLLQGKERITAFDVIDGYSNQDALCTDLFDECACHLGQLIAILMNTYDPECVYLGDAIPPSERFLNMVIFEAQKFTEIPVTLEKLHVMKKSPSDLDPILLGAASHTTDVWLSNLFGPGEEKAQPVPKTVTAPAGSADPPAAAPPVQHGVDAG